MTRALGLLATAAWLTAFLLGCAGSVEKTSAATTGLDHTRAVAVEYRGQSHSVDPRELEPMLVNGQQVLGFDAMLRAAWPDLSLGAVLLDFEGQDGFRPSLTGNCDAYAPVPGEVASQGGILLTSFDMLWSDSLDYPNCMSVRALERIIVTQP